MAKKNSKKVQYAGDGQTVALNKRARFEYELSEHLEAGLQLAGSEVKSARLGKVSIVEAFAQVKNGQVWLLNMHIDPYEEAGAFSISDARRERRLLLHKREIAKFAGRLNSPGWALVPLRAYFKNGVLKVEIALGKGKQAHDKRQTIRDRDNARELERVRKAHRAL